MKAVVYREYGATDVLHVEDVERPAVGQGEVLISVRAAEATKSDCELRSFHFPVSWFWLPLRVAFGVRKPKNPILGGYFAGVVEAVGPGVTRLQKGDEVFGTTGLRMGAYGAFVSLPEDSTIVLKPSNMSFEEAAAVPLGGLNALHFMRRAEVKSGERVLINGAGGSIGSWAIQLAKSMGAEVTAVDSGLKEQTVRRLGADHFIDYTRHDFTTAEQRYDVVLNMVAGISYRGCLGVLRPGGRYVLANPRLSDMLRAGWTSRLSDKQVIFAFAGEKPEELQALKEMIEGGDLGSTVDRVFALDRVAEAHQCVESERRLGSVVLSHQL